MNPISFTDDSYTSDSECSSADETTDYNSTETELSSSDESDCEEPKDKSCEQVSNGPFKDFSEDEKLGIVILAYIAKHKLNGSASVDLMDLLKLVAPENTNLQSLTLNQVKETLGDCIVNVYDYCGKCF